MLSKFVANPYACSFLFFGPPEVSKTSIAMAMAQEMGAEFSVYRQNSEIAVGVLVRFTSRAWLA